jgi:nucleotide-binding universal stress UspA family protein
VTAPLSGPSAVTRDRRSISVTIPIDGCESCWRAVSYAVGLATRHPGGAHAVFVWVQPPSGRESFTPEVVLVRAQTARDFEAELRERIADQMSGSGLSWEFRTRTGSRLAQLREVAQAARADLIVVGSRCRVTGWRSRRLAAALIAEAKWPVMAVP